MAIKGAIIGDIVGSPFEFNNIYAKQNIKPQDIVLKVDKGTIYCGYNDLLWLQSMLFCTISHLQRFMLNSAKSTVTKDLAGCSWVGSILTIRNHIIVMAMARQCEFLILLIVMAKGMTYW